MVNKVIPPARTNNFFRLPFKHGSRLLTLETLNRYSDFRKPKRPYLSIQIRKKDFHNELLTVSIILDNEDEELVYIKVTFSELLVSCSVDTDENYLSRYAYFTLFKMMTIYDLCDFEDYYWPDFFDTKTGGSKFLKVYKRRDSLTVAVKVIYKGIYKPENTLPIITKDVRVKRGLIIIPQEVQPKNEDNVLGFCLSDTHARLWRTNHYPFLIPYRGILNKNRSYVKSFKTYILAEKDLLRINLTSAQEELIRICLEMKNIAHVHQQQYGDNVQEMIEIHQKNKQNFARLFELWQMALPLLTSRLYIHYRFTYGMRNVKGKPLKSTMVPCTFSSEIPELCFLWKDKGDYYKLELRFMVGTQIHEVQQYFNTAFFIVSSKEPSKYFLLNSLSDCDLLDFFSKRHFQLLMLKAHYEVYCKDFVDQLRSKYRFFNR